MNEEQIAEFRRRYNHLCTVATRLEQFIHGYLEGIEHVDRIGSRAKNPDRFAAKARKTTDEGTAKYDYPLVQIQDQIGARVIVFYLSDVPVVSGALEKYFTHIEKKELVPESESEFGYFGKHWIFSLPDDVIPAGVDRDKVPRFFELQVKTLFQHAWAEANHDLAYKPTTRLTSLQKRQFAFTAAQAWGADQVFESLRAEIDAGALVATAGPGDAGSGSG